MTQDIRITWAGMVVLIWVGLRRELSDDAGTSPAFSDWCLAAAAFTIS